MVVDSIAIADDIIDSVVGVLLILDHIVYPVSYRITVCEVCIYCIVFVCIENGAIHIWDIESSCVCTCYYTYQD